MPTWTWVLAASSLSLALLLTRQPHTLVNPQMWAEDGKVWYRDAYLYGPLRPLLSPDAGYLNTFQRVVGALGLIIPLALLPLFFACVSAVVQVLPIIFLATDRAATVTRPRAIRLAIGLGTVALPNLAELTGNVTNTQWPLAVLAALVLVSGRTRNTAWRVFDVAVIVTSGLSGPFAFFLAPEAVLLAVIRRSRTQWTLALLVCTTALIQGTVLILSAPHQRANLLGPAHVDATAGAVIVVGRMLLAPLVGASRSAAFAVAVGPWGDLALATVGMAVILAALLWASTEVRLLLGFGVLTLAGTLAGTRNLWAAMVRPSAGERYWYIPMLTWVLALAVIGARSRFRWAKPCALYALLAVAVVGAPSGWRYPAPANAHFQEAASRFAAAAPGQAVTFEEDPPGWTFVLVKAGSGP
jgi:hypothetical protein